MQCSALTQGFSWFSTYLRLLSMTFCNAALCVTTVLRYEDDEAVEDFIAIGKDVNAADSEGRTPLHFAAGTNNEVIAVMLIEAGANLEAVDSKSNTPLHVSFCCGGSLSILILTGSGGCSHLLVLAILCLPLERLQMERLSALYVLFSTRSTFVIVWSLVDFLAASSYFGSGCIASNYESILQQTGFLGPHPRITVAL